MKVEIKISTYNILYILIKLIANYSGTKAYTSSLEK